MAPRSRRRTLFATLVLLALIPAPIGLSRGLAADPQQTSDPLRASPEARPPKMLLEAVSVGPSPFSPGIPDGVKDSTTLSFDVLIRPPKGLTHDGRDEDEDEDADEDDDDMRARTQRYLVRWRWTIVLSGQDSVVIIGEKEIQPPLTIVDRPLNRRRVAHYAILQVSSAWDGRDSHSGIVPDGNFGYRMEAQFVRVREFRDGRRKERVLGTAGPVRGSVASNSAVPPAPLLNPHTTLTRDPAITITGTAVSAVSIEVSNPTGIQVAPVAGGAFSVSVALKNNSINHIVFTAISNAGVRSVSSATQVTHDGEPPNVFIDFPVEGAELTAPETDVAGRVSDLLSGFNGLHVTVNGREAVVDVGIGTNGTFFLPALPLVEDQPIQIVAIATDVLGNSRSATVAVRHVRLPPDAPRLAVLTGGRQTGPIHEFLPEPVVLALTQGGTPQTAQDVRFRVVRSDGRVAEIPGVEGSMLLQMKTNAQGQVRVFWRLGADAGCGNNRLEVTAEGVTGSLTLCASSTPGPATQINVGSGNSQRIEADAPTQEPLRAWVSDACNGVEGVPVTFRVTEGGGLIDGQMTAIVSTGPTGHAAVQFKLGPEPGNNVVEATIGPELGQTAQFVLFGVRRNPGQPTRLTGLVLDNASQLIGGAICRYILGGQVVAQTTSDAMGQFRFEGIPSGQARMQVDGLTATSLSGQPIPPGSFPALAYDLLVVPQADNSLPMPVLLPPLNPNNARSYSTSHDTELTLEGLEGLKMIVRAGSMTVNGQPAPDGTAIALNQVHHDDIPMPLPDGAAPPFAWTLQPAGAHFDPPVQIIYPNMSGLPPGSVAYFLSFNHETNRFEIVASGTVTTDGLSIMTDPGVGITVSGWGCNCPPYSVTGGCNNCDFPPNGCGQPGNFFANPRNLNYIAVAGCGPIPEVVCFLTACNQHDTRYSQCDLPKADADDEFLENLRSICDSRFPGLSNICLRAECKAKAYAFYQGVHLGGQGAYNDAQREACRCQRRSPRVPFGVLAGDRFQSRITALVDSLPADADGDLMPDVWELAHGLNPNNPNDAALDPDQDTLTSFEEYMAGMDPRNADSDGDGVPDAVTFANMQGPPPDALDPSWTVSVSGQTAVPSSAGAIHVNNIAAADLFGPGGPGSRPDFVSDDALRVIGLSTTSGITRYVFSEPFRIRSGQVFVLGGLTFTVIPPPLPVTLALAIDAQVLNAINQSTQLHTTAVLGNGSHQDVTPVTAWTSYRTSNATTASIDENGVVTARGAGPVFLTATNGGATSTLRIVCVPGDPLTRSHRLRKTGRRHTCAGGDRQGRGHAGYGHDKRVGLLLHFRPSLPGWTADAHGVGGSGGAALHREPYWGRAGSGGHRVRWNDRDEAGGSAVRVHAQRS